ncbi:hypothetical protein C8R47DRAFT_1160359 [Mycena vitilis]|nr:hypothetical protein C8R47DRAFT_1160359 [Mycena vitilis]
MIITILAVLNLSDARSLSRHDLIEHVVLQWNIERLEHRGDILSDWCSDTRDGDGKTKGNIECVDACCRATKT